MRQAGAIGVDIAWTARWRAAWPDEASNEGRGALLTALTDNWPLVAEGAGAEAPAIVSLAVANVLRWWP